jgi:hypothetical protein
VGVGGRTLDATVDALAVSGVTLELVPVALARGFFSAERAGGGGRREYEREGDREGVGELEWDRDCKWERGWCAEAGRTRWDAEPGDDTER